MKFGTTLHGRISICASRRAAQTHAVACDGGRILLCIVPVTRAAIVAVARAADVIASVAAAGDTPDDFQQCQTQLRIIHPCHNLWQL